MWAYLTRIVSGKYKKREEWAARGTIGMIWIIVY